MKRIMIYILLSALIAVSLVSADELGVELVTCGDFSCNDTWVGLIDTQEVQLLTGLWTRSNNEEVAVLSGGTPFPPAVFVKNFTQEINIKLNRVYTISGNLELQNVNNRLDISLGGVTTELSETVPFAFSFNITTINNDGLLNITGRAVQGSRINFNSISVKEIIPPPNIIMRYDDGDDTAIVPQNMIERFDDGTIEISVPKNIFRRFVRWIRSLA